jgi:hypothetical protein
MGEYERSERIGADIERTANTVNPRLPPIEPELDEPKIEDGEENEADPGPMTT